MPEEKEERGVASVAKVSEDEADRQHLQEAELRNLCTKGDLLGNKSDELRSCLTPEGEWREVVYPPVWREVVCPPGGAKGTLGETRETLRVKVLLHL